MSEAEWIKVFSNGKTADGRLPGDGNSSAQFWHTDFTPWEAPVGHIAIDCRQTVEPAPDRAGHPPERPLAAAGGPQNQDAASSRASPSWHRKPILYLPTRRDSLIPGMDEVESGALLTDLSDFVDFAHGLDLATLRGEVLRQSRLNILDTLGGIAAEVTEQVRAA